MHFICIYSKDRDHKIEINMIKFNGNKKYFEKNYKSISDNTNLEIICPHFRVKTTAVWTCV